MDQQLTARLTTVLGTSLERLTAISSSWGLVIYKAETVDGKSFAVKAGRSHLEGHLETEAMMLGALGRDSTLPVPQVIHGAADLLVMNWIENDGGPVTAAHQRHAGELVAALHMTPRARFGYDRPTVIGGLAQPNEPCASWIEFFRDRRLLPFARHAHDRARMPAALLHRLETLGGHLDEYLSEPDHPALLHGDMWSGNVLVRGEAVAAFIDPAVYCSHPEIELAFTTLFSTFGNTFFDAYRAHAPLASDFFDLRRDLYNIYPNLVHAILFGPSYFAPIDQVLKRLGI